jgi:cyclase
MLTKRIIPCLDVINRRVTKGVKFQNNIDLGDPIEMAVRYSDGGCDELVVYDITASAERRPIDIAMVRDVAQAIRIPFAVGGGIATVEDMSRVLLAGAEKISVNSLAVKNPEIIAEGARAFGAQCIVLGMDPVSTPDRAQCPSGYEITTRGFRERTGMDAVEWARRGAELGVGEILLNSMDADGTKAGFDLAMLHAVRAAVTVPVIASGGAGAVGDFAPAVRAGADAVLAASVFHFGELTIGEVKAALAAEGITVR